MKYEVIIYVKNEHSRKVDIVGASKETLEQMEQEGEFLCPGKNCSAKLCLVHNSRNGGRTCFLKAVDDEKHNPECEYKISNYKERNASVLRNGIFMEKQLNDAARRIFNDYVRPLNPMRKEKKRKSSSGGTKTKKDNTGTKTNVTASGGRVIHGDENGEGIKGRMRRKYRVTNADIGIMISICGKAKTIEFNEYKELLVTFAEERLENIKVFLGPIYEQNNPMEYKNLYLVKEYFDSLSDGKEVYVAASGLVNTKKDDLVLVVQTNRGLIVDGKTVTSLALSNARRNL